MWNYDSDGINDYANENNYDGNKVNDNKTIASKSFNTKIMGRTRNDNKTLGTEIVFLLKYLRNFWRVFDFPLINCEIKTDLSWSKECIISKMLLTP